MKFLQSIISDADRIDQVKSYAIGATGIVGGNVSKVVFFSYSDFIAIIQDATIIGGFLLVVVRLAIDVRKWWRGRNVIKD